MKIICILMLMVLISCPTILSAEEIKGQKPMMLIGETFQFVQGSWGRYFIHDRQNNEYYQMSIAILEKERRDSKDCSWMEVEIISENNPPVVTKFLAEETKEGPGDLKEVIVQVKGYSPFIVPGSFYEGKDKEVGDFKTAHMAKRIEKNLINYKNKALNVWKVEAQDPKGKTIDALISEEVPPIGVVMVESPELGMYLDDWGINAKSKIEGTPLNFYIWLIHQTFEGMGE
jgi:hypothetical protein